MDKPSGFNFGSKTDDIPKPSLETKEAPKTSETKKEEKPKEPEKKGQFLDNFVDRISSNFKTSDFLSMYVRTWVQLGYPDFSYILPKKLKWVKFQKIENFEKSIIFGNSF